MVARVARICGKSDTAPLELMYFVLQQHERGGDDGVCGLMQTQTWYKLSLKQDWRVFRQGLQAPSSHVSQFGLAFLS